MATSQFASLSEPRTSAVLLLHRRNVRIPLVLLFHANILQRIKIYTSWIYTGRPLISCEGRGGEGEFAEDPIEGPSSGGFWTGEDISGALVKCVFLERILKKGKIFFNTWWSVSSFGDDKFLESIFMDLFFFFFISLCVMYNRRMRAGRRIIFVMSSRWWIVLSNYLSIECLGKQVCYRRR